MPLEENRDDEEPAATESIASTFPPLAERIAQYEQWVQTVRDPADLATEGVRRLESRNRKAVAEYEIAPLPDGRFAVRVSCSYRPGDCSGVGTPWMDFETREECVEFFLELARRHFGNASSVTELRSEMQALLRETLYGFVEPAPNSSSK